MPARSRTQPDPLDETPFWRTRGFVLALAAVAVLAAAGLTAWLVRVNKRQQREWRLDDDPQLALLRQSLTKEIAKAKPGQVRAPAALWLGKVREFTVSQSTDGSPAVSLLKMEDASLLAGARGHKDAGDAVTISGGSYTFGGPQPRPGETWLVAVWRDTAGDNNFIHTAARAAIR